MSRAIQVKVRRFKSRPVGVRYADRATETALSLPIESRHETRTLAYVLTGATADPARETSVPAIALHKCGAGDSGLTRYARRANAAGQVKRMRGPTAAESRSIAARLEAVGGL